MNCENQHVGIRPQHAMPYFHNFEIKITIFKRNQRFLKSICHKMIKISRFYGTWLFCLNYLQFRNQNHNFQIKISYFWSKFDKNAAFMSIFNGKNDENAAFLRYVVQIDKYVKLVVMYVIFIERRNDFKQKLWFLNFWS